VTIAAERVDDSAACFNAVARDRLTADDLVPELRVDLELSLGEANDELESLMRHLEPCGVGNPAPVLATRARLAAPPRVVGREHLRLVLGDDGRELGAIGWGMGKRVCELEAGQSVDVAFRLERDEWQGESRLQAKLVDFRA
jgi:single-stranded-DNA-specific exonuclease